MVRFAFVVSAPPFARVLEGLVLAPFFAVGHPLGLGRHHVRPADTATALIKLTPRRRQNHRHGNQNDAGTTQASIH